MIDGAAAAGSASATRPSSAKSVLRTDAGAPRMRPPAPLVSTLGTSRSATLLVSYCWTQPLRGGGGRETCADGTLGHPAHTLRWRPGAPITIDLRLPAHDVHIQAAQIAAGGRPSGEMLFVRARRLGRTGRRWSIRLPVRAERDNDLLISATFTRGDIFAELGLETIHSGAPPL